MVVSMFGVRQRLWQATARVLANTRTERVMDAMLTIQKTRAWVEEVQDEALHLASLPTRQDVRKLQRQVSSLRRRVVQLDLAVAELERALQSNRQG